MQRYLTLAQSMQEIFGCRVLKLPVNAGLSCPNRDRGTACVFCSDGASAFTYAGTIYEQMRQQSVVARRKNPDAYLAYFQSYSNTYGPTDQLRDLYEQALSFPKTVGLAIATRADCLDDEKLDLLYEFSQKTFLWVEIGVQSMNEDTADRISRGYGRDLLLEKLTELKNRKIRTVCHLIAGLPEEKPADFLNSVEELADFGIWGFKFHALFVQPGSRHAEIYAQKPFSFLSGEEYAQLAATAIGLTYEDQVIHRLTGDPDKQRTYQPTWTADKLALLTRIHAIIKEKGIKQKQKRD